MSHTSQPPRRDLYQIETETTQTADTEQTTEND